MINFRRAIASAGLFIIVCTAEAQTLIVQPRGLGELTVYSGKVIVDGDVENIPEGAFPIQVLLVMSSEVFDVTDLASFTVSDTDIAAFDGGMDLLTFAAKGSVVLEAHYGSLVGSAIFNNVDAFDDQTPGGDAINNSQGGAWRDQGDAVPRSVLTERTNEFIAGLGSYNIPVQKLALSSHGAKMYDDRDTYYKTGIQFPVTEPFTTSTKGRFLSKGWHWNFFQSPLTGPFITTDEDIIVLNGEIADLLEGGVSNLLGESGPKNPGGYVLLEKLMLAAAHHAGLDKDFGKDALENIAEKLTRTTIPRMKTIHDLLQKPINDWQQIDVDRLRNSVQGIRNDLTHGTYDSIRDKWGDEAVDAFLDMLDWEDSDGDGLPDWLEDYLRDHGFDPDNLPETPEDLPGYEPPPPPWIPGHFHPPTFLPVPIIVPVDPS